MEVDINMLEDMLREKLAPTIYDVEMLRQEVKQVYACCLFIVCLLIVNILLMALWIA